MGHMLEQRGPASVLLDTSHFQQPNIQEWEAVRPDVVGDNLVEDLVAVIVPVSSRDWLSVHAEEDADEHLLGSLGERIEDDSCSPEERNSCLEHHSQDQDNAQVVRLAVTG